MTPMKRRMSRSSRLDSGRTIAVTWSARPSAASAIDGAPGVDPDPFGWQEHREHALLRDAAPPDQVDWKVGAQEDSCRRVAGEVGPEERAQEGERVHAHGQSVRLAPAAVVDHDVFRSDGEGHLRPGGEAVDVARELGVAEPDRPVPHDGPG